MTNADEPGRATAVETGKEEGRACALDLRATSASHHASFFPPFARRSFLAGAIAAPGLVAITGRSAFAKDPRTTLLVAGPRTPESLDQEYPPTEAVMEARRNINEPLLRYALRKSKDGIWYEDFGKIIGNLAAKWEVTPDKKTITFHLRDGVLSSAGNRLTADDVMWSFHRGWALKANFYWYMSQVLNIRSPDKAFRKIDASTVQVNIPYSSPLVDKLWTNIGLGILDAQELRKHVTPTDPWASRWVAVNSASYGPYSVTSANYTPGQQIIYEATPHYFRGAARIKRVIFREIPTSANRVAALEAGAVDVAEFLTPRQLALLQKDPKTKVWAVYGNYINRVEMNVTMSPFKDVRVRQALNYLVPRTEILQAVYFGMARITKSPISEIYPGYTDKYFPYGTTADVPKAKALLAAAGFAHGFTTELGYRSDDEIDEQIAVILKTAFARAGIDLKLLKMPASTLVERYTKGNIPMWFYNDMAIVPDATYAANLWLNSASVTDYSRFKSAEVDALLNADLKMTDETKRLADSHRVQEIFMRASPWVFLMNPGYQLATRSNVKGYTWYTPNANDWYDFYKD